MTMTTPFRNETETLRSQLAMVTAERDRLAAELHPPPTAKVPTRWNTKDVIVDSFTAFLMAIFWCLMALIAVAAPIVQFVGAGSFLIRDASYWRYVAVVVSLAALWCLAFVRRVPR